MRRNSDEIARAGNGTRFDRQRCRPKPSLQSTGNAAGTTPAEQFTITNYYKQDVYDRSLNFVGTVDDVLIDQQGKITALIIGVGGFLGIGRKDFSQPFGRVQMAKKNDKWYLVMDADKETLSVRRA